MATYRKPRGQYVRSTGDWYVGRTMGGGGMIAAFANAYSHVSLYNSATDGSVLLVTAVSAWSHSATNTIRFHKGPGPIGSIIAGAANPVDPVVGALAGQVYSGSGASQNGTEIFVAGGNGQPWDWPHDWPFAILESNAQLFCYTDGTNVAISAGYQWLVLPCA